MNIKYFLLLCLITISCYSCSKSCADVSCDYDAICEDGDCTCVDVTKNYLLGTWELESTGKVIGTFNSDNTYTDSFGNIVSWELDSIKSVITLTPGNIIIVSKNGFSCSRMMVTIDDGSDLIPFEFVRQ